MSPGTCNLLTQAGLWLKDLDLSRTSLELFIGVYTLAAVLESVGMLAMLW